jgi:4a-hydroxytetrahydrobiopterin dehydratase
MPSGVDPLTTDFKKKDWSTLARRACTATEIVANLAKLDNWKLTGEEQSLAIEKTFNFANYFETIAFVNALAFIVHKQNHHPDLSVHYSRCVVRFNTHDVGGLTATDFECAAMIDGLIA